MKLYPQFDFAISDIEEKMLNQGYPIETEKWQGIKLPQPMRELLNESFQVLITGGETKWVEQIKPNLPWADQHFLERVGGRPFNPDPSHKIWPFAQKNNNTFTNGEKFTHTYSERLWPKHAGIGEEYREAGDDSWNLKDPIKGIRYNYGDLQDVITLLEKEPLTRQAYLPLWFPEDTGVVHGGRVPCTLGYHIIRRQDNFYINYYMRSCDLIRHFRDDIYLAMRLFGYILNELKNRDIANWGNVCPGIFTMHITSLHCFESDMYSLRKKYRNEGI